MAESTLTSQLYILLLGSQRLTPQVERILQYGLSKQNRRQDPTRNKERKEHLRKVHHDSESTGIAFTAQTGNVYYSPSDATLQLSKSLTICYADKGQWWIYVQPS